MEVEAPIIRGTLTPNPAPMEADGGGSVYQVSHVVDGELVNLLRRNHSDHYYFAIRPRALRVFLGKELAWKMIGAFSRAK